jgi:NADP-dependent 3-hydroxy acid dehydrogenase YdfG
MSVSSINSVSELDPQAGAQSAPSPAPTAPIAWITGATGGLGKAAAVSLAGLGYRVVVSGRSDGRIQETVDAVASVGGVAHGVPLDVTDGVAVKAAHALIERDLGEVEVLVCSAGTNVPNRWWDNLDPEDFTRVVETNLNSVTRCVSAVLPAMRRQGFGQIIVVSSWAGWRYMSGAGAAYGASKTALGPLVASINDQEGRRGIRATHLCPGEVDTPILQTKPVPPGPEDIAKMLKPEDVGSAIAYIAGLPPHVCVNEMVVTPVWNRMDVDYSAYPG